MFHTIPTEERGGSISLAPSYLERGSSQTRNGRIEIGRIMLLCNCFYPVTVLPFVSPTSPFVITMYTGHVRDHPLLKMRTLRISSFICVLLSAKSWKPGLAIPSTGPLPCCLWTQQWLMWNPGSQGSASPYTKAFGVLACGGWGSSSLGLHREEGSN